MQILHRPLTRSRHPESAWARCPELLARYVAHFPDSEACNVDFEDWTENTVMLSALEDQAKQIGVPFRLLDLDGNQHISGIAGQSPRSTPDAPETVMWGCYRTMDAVNFPEPVSLHWSDRSRSQTVMRWPLSETFKKHAGRHVEILDMSIEAVREAFARMVARGKTAGFLKTVEKSWAQKIDIQKDIPADIGWDIVANEGAKNALILQDFITPVCEYRIFVVGDTPITGAGCIEKFTPLDRMSGEIPGFDPRVEADRNRGAICEHPALVSDYVEFAKTFAKDWASEHGQNTAYTLDLCVDLPSRKIMPIELNPMLNTGLYASDPALLAQALVTPLTQGQS